MDYLLYVNVVGRHGCNVPCELAVSDDSFGLSFPYEFVWDFDDGETRFVKILRPGLNTKVNRKRCFNLTQALLGHPRNDSSNIINAGLSDCGSYAEVLKRILIMLFITNRDPATPITAEYLIKKERNGKCLT